MYSFHKNIQIILAQLKRFGINKIVCSAGTRNIPLVFSAVQDDYFQCYSIVDERSAGFFAIGLIQTLQEPVAIVCTSGTAAANYVSAANEAFYQHLPLVILTADRNHYDLNQQEDQCIPQLNLYKDVVRRMVDLPIVRDDYDFWYCNRLVNEALLELDHREKGPVHINFQVDYKYPIKGGDFVLDQPNLPVVQCISRIMADDPEIKWKHLATRLLNKKIFVLYGQNLPISQDETDRIDLFCDMYDVVVFNEHLSNRHCKAGVVNAVDLSVVDWNKYAPDIVITMGGHRMADPKGALLAIHDKFEHWHVSRDGVVSDPYHCQSMIVECSQDYFFRKMIEYGTKVNRKVYYESWRAMERAILKKNPSFSDFAYSGDRAIKLLTERIPKGSLLHVSNSNSIRLATYFTLPEGVDFFVNRGTCGIDGSMSSYVAQSYISSRPSFLCIGDLSFFYDMNALWNKYINGNTRIMLINNGGGAILNFGAYKTVNRDGAPVNTAASHKTSAKGWVESRGFKYLCAHNNEELDSVINEFVVDKSENPILLEIFTDIDVDILERSKIVALYRGDCANLKKSVTNCIPSSVKLMAKKILKK